MVGQEVVRQLSADPSVGRILAYARKRPSHQLPKVEHWPFSLQEFDIPQGVHMVLCALGTTMRKAGSREAFIRVDHDSVLAIGGRANSVGIERFGIVSSLGADAKSINFYLRIKGQADEGLKAIGFKRLAILKPSLLLGNRTEKRMGENIGRWVYRCTKFLFVGPLAKYRGIEAVDVAKTLISIVRDGEGTITIDSESIKIIANGIR